MKITVITLFPEMFSGFLDESILKRAQEKKAVEISLVDLRDFAEDAHKSVDDRPYGGGAGMVLRADILAKAIASVKTKSPHKHSAEKIILTSAKGYVYDQAYAQQLASLDHLVIVAGHYEGVDERIMSEIDEEISLGDFVLTGGEIPAAAIIDSIVRLIPSVLKKEEATAEESFFEVGVDELSSVVGKDSLLPSLMKKGKKFIKLLEYPHYTRPEVVDGKTVPEALLSGDHKKIREFRLKAAYEETKKKRPDLLDI